MGLFKSILGGVDVPRLIEAKDYDGLLKASVKKDPEIRARAVQGLAGLGENARNYLASKLRESDGAQNAQSAAILKEMDWVPRTIDERILLLMGLNSWERLLALGEDAIAPLMQTAKARKPGDPIRSAALMALGHYRRPETIDFIVDFFQQSLAANIFDVYFALGCLKRMGREAVRPLSETLYDDKTPQQTRIWATQIMSMIGPPAVEALISINRNPPGSVPKALESWTFSLQALAGIADEKALGYIREGALQSLRNIQVHRRVESEAAKELKTVLAIFEDPPRSIVKYVKLGGPMRSYQIIAILASGNRRETQSIKAFIMMGGAGIAEAIMGSTDTFTMDALDKIGGDEATKIMIDHIQGNVGSERMAKAIMMVDKNSHPSMLEYLERFDEKSASGLLDRAASALTLIHLKERSRCSTT